MSLPISRARKEKLKKKIDTTIDQWKEIETIGDIPYEIYGHTSVYHQETDSIFVIGGSNKEGKVTLFAFRFEFATSTWTQLQLENFTGRNFHSSVLYNDKIYIFGGKNVRYLNDLYVFDIYANTCTHETNFIGTPPSRRYGHSAVLYNKCMYIYGGYDDSGFRCSEIYEYRIENKQWRQITTSGQAPDRLHHTAVIYQGSMYVFGGLSSYIKDNQLYEFRFDTKFWSVVQATGIIPEERSGHCAVVFQNKLMIIGGCNAVVNFKDLHSYDFENCNWIKIKSEGMEPRHFASAIVRGSFLYIFAGKNIHQYCFNTLEYISLDVNETNRPDRFMEQMSSLVDNPDFSDCEIFFPKENKIIRAHKALLAIRSERFDVMFKTGMKESKDNRILIEDYSYDLFKVFLHYVYTSKLQRLEDPDLLDMLRLSDQYMIGHLKRLCEVAITSLLDMKNVNTIFSFSEKYTAPDLRRACVLCVIKYYDSLDDEEKKSLDKLLLNEARLMKREEESSSGW